MDWSPYFPAYVDGAASTEDAPGPKALTKDVEVVDIGCGFGGLLMALSPALPDQLLLGECTRGMPHCIAIYAQARPRERARAY